MYTFIQMYAHKPADMVARVTVSLEEPKAHNGDHQHTEDYPRSPKTLLEKHFDSVRRKTVQQAVKTNEAVVSLYSTAAMV